MLKTLIFKGNSFFFSLPNIANSFLCATQQPSVPAATHRGELLLTHLSANLSSDFIAYRLSLIASRLLPFAIGDLPFTSYHLPAYLLNILPFDRLGANLE
jgi:hypothetical protein